jgi:flagellar biosynthetic protein FliR
LIAFVTEMFAVAAQAISLPAGYTYASAVDPATQAESNVLIILAQLTSGLLFFALGLHRQLILALARGLDSHPPGQYSITVSIAEEVVRVGSSVFRLGFELALPILALLAMVDISLALLGRLNSQLQVITLSFPVKMLMSLGLLAALGPVLPRLFQKAANPVMTTIAQLLSAG